MEHANNWLSDISYKSELTPHLFSIQGVLKFSIT